jgi:hypothetical protein
VAVSSFSLPLPLQYLPRPPCAQSSRHIKTPNSNDPSRRPGPMTLKTSPNLPTGHGVLPKHNSTILHQQYYSTRHRLSREESKMREWYLVTLAARRFPPLCPGRTRSDTPLAHPIHPCRSARSISSFTLSDSRMVAEDCGASLEDEDDGSVSETARHSQ